MKLLVVTDGQPIGMALKKVLPMMLGITESDVLTAKHADALRTFLTEQPTHVIVFEYEEGSSRFASKGAGTWRDLTASSTGSARIIRTGFQAHPGPDFVRLPWDYSELFTALGVTTSA